jgi:hypothetical protein
MNKISFRVLNRIIFEFFELVPKKWNDIFYYHINDKFRKIWGFSNVRILRIFFKDKKESDIPLPKNLLSFYTDLEFLEYLPKRNCTNINIFEYDNFIKYIPKGYARIKNFYLYSVYCEADTIPEDINLKPDTFIFKTFDKIKNIPEGLNPKIQLILECSNYADFKVLKGLRTLNIELYAWNCEFPNDVECIKFIINEINSNIYKIPTDIKAQLLEIHNSNDDHPSNITKINYDVKILNIVLTCEKMENVNLPVYPLVLEKVIFVKQKKIVIFKHNIKTFKYILKHILTEYKNFECINI